MNNTSIVSLVEAVGEVLPFLALIGVPPLMLLSIAAFVTSIPAGSPWPKRVAIGYSASVTGFLCLGWIGGQGKGGDIEISSLAYTIFAFAVAVAICQIPIGKFRAVAKCSVRVPRRENSALLMTVCIAILIAVACLLFLGSRRELSPVSQGAQVFEPKHYVISNDDRSNFSQEVKKLQPVDSVSMYKDVCEWTPMMRVAFRAIYSQAFECWPLHDRVTLSSEVALAPTKMQQIAQVALLTTYSFASPDDEAGFQALAAAVRSLSEAEAVALVREITRRGPAGVSQGTAPLMPRPMTAYEILRFYGIGNAN